MNSGREHLGQGNKRTIDGKEYMFKHLTMNEVPDIMSMGKAFTAIKAETKKELTDEEAGMLFFQKMDRNTMNIMVGLVKIMLERSFPDWTPDERDQFGTANFMELFGVVMQMNQLSKQSKDREMGESVRKLREKINAANTKPDSGTETKESQ